MLPVIGLHGLVLGDIASFVLSAVVLVPLARVAENRVSGAADSSVGPVRAIMIGARAVRADRTLVAAIVITFLSAAAQGLFLVLFQDLSVEAANGLGSSGSGSVRTLFVLICLLGCVLVLSTVGINVAIERDWLALKLLQ